MSDAKLITELSEAAVLLKPLRLEMMRLLEYPQTCGELAGELGVSVQKANYHVKVLREAGLVAQVARRQVRGTVQGIYRAVPGSIQLAPGLLEAGAGAALLSIDTTIRLPDGASQQAFIDELSNVVRELANKHGASSDEVSAGNVLKLMTVCYPAHAAKQIELTAK